MGLHHLRTDNAGTCPAFELDTDIQRRGILDPEEAQVIFQSRFGSRELRRYRLEWPDATEGQAHVIRTLFQAAGNVEAMNFIPPDEEEIVEVRFIDDLKITRTSATTWAISFDVEEVLR